MKESRHPYFFEIFLFRSLKRKSRRFKIKINCRAYYILKFYNLEKPIYGTTATCRTLIKTFTGPLQNN